MHYGEVLSLRLPRKVILDDGKKLHTTVILGTISLPIPSLQNAAFQSGLMDDRTGLGMARHRTFQGEDVTTEADGGNSVAATVNRIYSSLLGLFAAAMLSLQRETVKSFVR